MKKKTRAFFLAVCAFFFTGCHPKTPVIQSIYPQIGNMGEPVTITGEFFGKERDESYITLAGSRPTSMSYLKWQDNEITFKAPEFGEAGLIYVYVNGRKSNGMLFTNSATLPKQVQGGETGLGPRITAITPQSGAIGSLLTITGTGFGSSRGEGGVFFSWNAEMTASAPVEARVQGFTEASEADFCYELWTEREIHVRVPDGAAGGNIEIRTARGKSPPLFFDLSGRPGTKIYRDKRSYTLSYSVNVKTAEADWPNTLYLWVPRPAASAAQRNMELLSFSKEPFVENYRGTSLFKMDDLYPYSETQINMSWKVEVYSVETSIRPQSVKQDTNTQVNEIYTLSSSQLPSDDPRMKNQAAAIVSRERNPYLKAQSIYEWMLGGFVFHQNQVEGDIFSALETKNADSYIAALLYCTLLRSAGVPCLPVAGVLVSRNRQTLNHYWAEFWIDGFGWIPVDPVMGAEAVPAMFGDHPDRANYYFGSIDSQRIAFSRGFNSLSPMDPRGRTVTHSRSYSLQNLWEEVVGGIESYSSLWGDITITGMYAQ